MCQSENPETEDPHARAPSVRTIDESSRWPRRRSNPNQCAAEQERSGLAHPACLLLLGFVMFEHRNLPHRVKRPTSSLRFKVKPATISLCLWPFSPLLPNTEYISHYFKHNCFASFHLAYLLLRELRCDRSSVRISASANKGLITLKVKLFRTTA